MTRINMLSCLGIILCGCSAVLNPYQSSFNCPETEKGKCVSVQSAYRDSLNPLVKPDGGQAGEVGTSCGKGQPGEMDASPQEKEYRSALLQRLTGLLKEPETPMVAPPRVMRVLLLPYRGEDGELFMPRYAYFFLDKPSWVLDGYIVEKGEN